MLAYLNFCEVTNKKESVRFVVLEFWNEKKIKRKKRKLNNKTPFPHEIDGELSDSCLTLTGQKI